MKYLFDTDHISFIQRRADPEHAILMARIAPHPPTDFAISIVSFHEQAIGAHTYLLRAKDNSGLIRGYELFREILSSFSAARVLSFDATAASIVDYLRQNRVRIATMDLRIAAIALANGAILLTRNSADFAQVPGLAIEDWTK